MTKSAAKSARKSAAENEVKNVEQLFGIYHNCFRLSGGTLLAARVLSPFPGDLAVSQALSLSQYSAARGRT